VRTLLIGALAAALLGCSRQQPSQAAADSCPGKNPLACFMAVRLPLESTSLRMDSAQADAKPDVAPKTEPPSLAPARHRTGLAGTTAKPAAVAAKAEHSASSVQLAGNAPTTASDSRRTSMADSHSTAGSAH